METFIVRVWASDGGPEAGSAASLRGVVRHVRSGREASFVSWEELRGALAGGVATSSDREASAVLGEGEA